MYICNYASALCCNGFVCGQQSVAEKQSKPPDKKVGYKVGPTTYEVRSLQIAASRDKIEQVGRGEGASVPRNLSMSSRAAIPSCLIAFPWPPRMMDRCEGLSTTMVASIMSLAPGRSVKLLILT